MKSSSLINIGNIEIKNPVFLAPMAGITDAIYRYFSYLEGVGLTTSEMILANHRLQDNGKTDKKLGEQFLDRYTLEKRSYCYGIPFTDIENLTQIFPRSIQILGYDPKEMGNLASFLSDSNQVDFIDINMGCPAKKVMKKVAGSALMGNPSLVSSIIENVVKSSTIPVTLKIRTGLTRDNKNILDLALRAQDLGIKMITIHGRTREDLFNGEAEFETIRTVKDSLEIPVIANGDINSVERFIATKVKSGADACMIGRASQGNPWLIGQCVSYCNNEEYVLPNFLERLSLMIKHIKYLVLIYEPQQAVRIARKHFIWYLQTVFPAIYNIDHPYVDFKKYQYNNILSFGKEFPLYINEEEKNKVRQLIKGNDFDGQYIEELESEFIKNEISSWKTKFVRLNTIEEQYLFLAYMEEFCRKHFT